MDYSLYLVTDQDCLRNQTLEQAVESAIMGGVTMVQLREKNRDSRTFYEQALSIKQVCYHHDVPLLINDRVDIALAIDADGVHVGQSDLPCAIVRKILGKDKIIGVSARTVTQAQQAQVDGADYLGVGAMFGTSTKHDAKKLDFATLNAITKAVDIPIVAIGGINETTLPVFTHELLANTTRIDGVAVVSAILDKADCQYASQQLRQLVNDYKQLFMEKL